MEISLLSGARRLTRGIRTGNAGVALVGALVTALVIIRRGAAPRREKVSSLKVKPGQSVRVEVVRPD